jgi:hypothetical protein
MSIIIFILLFLLLADKNLAQKIKEKYKLLNNYAVDCILNNLWKEARFYLKRAYALNQDSSIIRANLAVVYEFFTNKKEALSLYKTILKDNNKLFKENYEGFIKEAQIKPVKEFDKKKIRLATLRLMKPGIIDLRTIEKIGILFTCENNKYNIATISNTLLSQFNNLLDFKLNLLQGTSNTSDYEYIISCNILNYKDTSFRDYKIKSLYSKEDKAYQFYREELVTKEIEVELDILLYKGEKVLFSKNYKKKKTTLYSPCEAMNQRDILSLICSDITKNFTYNIIPSKKVFKRYIFLY